MIVDETGVTLDAETDILARLKASVRGAIDPALSLEADTPEGAILAAVVPDLRELQEHVQASMIARDPTQATGAQLVGIAAINNLYPLSAQATKIGCTLNLDAGVTVPAGSIVAVVGHTEITGTLQDAVTSATAGDYEGTFVLSSTGPIEVPAGTFTEIQSAVTGWNSVTNASDGVAGRNTETWEELRIRRRLSLGNTGRGGAAAITAGLLDGEVIQGIKQVTVYENPSNETSGNLPPHSFEVVIWDDGTDADEVAQVIFDRSVGGCELVGTTYGTAVDTDGNQHVVYFSRVVEIPIYVGYTLSGSSVVGDITSNVVSRGNALLPGNDVLVDQIRSSIYIALGAETKVTACNIGLAAGTWATGDISIGYREKAVFAADRVSVL